MRLNIKSIPSLKHLGKPWTDIDPKTHHTRRRHGWLDILTLQDAFGDYGIEYSRDDMLQWYDSAREHFLDNVFYLSDSFNDFMADYKIHQAYPILTDMKESFCASGTIFGETDTEMIHYTIWINSDADITASQSKGSNLGKAVIQIMLFFEGYPMCAAVCAYLPDPESEHGYSPSLALSKMTAKHSENEEVVQETFMLTSRKACTICNCILATFLLNHQDRIYAFTIPHGQKKDDQGNPFPLENFTGHPITYLASVAPAPVSDASPSDSAAPRSLDPSTHRSLDSSTPRSLPPSAALPPRPNGLSFASATLPSSLRKSGVGGEGLLHVSPNSDPIDFLVLPNGSFTLDEPHYGLTNIFHPLKKDSPVYQQLSSQFSSHDPVFIGGMVVPYREDGDTHLVLAKVYIVRCANNGSTFFLSDHPKVLSLFE